MYDRPIGTTGAASLHLENNHPAPVTDLTDAEVAEQITKLADAARNQNFEGLRLARLALEAIRPWHGVARPAARFDRTGAPV